MKEILKSRIKKASTKRHIDDERKILAAVKSEYLVELKVAFQDETKLYLIVNYVAGGELFYHLRKEGRFPMDVAKFYAAEILMALVDLHK
jgi:serine/threonine protein kinase